MKNVFITGAGRRLGKHLAIDFAKKGYNVAVHYNTSEKGACETVAEIQKQGVQAVAVQADLRNPEEIISAFNYASAELGQFDLLINNAAVFPDRVEVAEISPEMWDDTMNTNTRAILLTTQQFIKHANPKARIINIASLGGQEVWKQRVMYNVSKAGVLQLTKSLAYDLAPEFSVNSISPVGVLMPDDDTGTQLPPLSKIPMGRYGTPADIFDCAYFFAECSHYITGQNLNV